MYVCVLIFIQNSSVSTWENYQSDLEDMKSKLERLETDPRVHPHPPAIVEVYILVINYSLINKTQDQLKDYKKI